MWKRKLNKDLRERFGLLFTQDTPSKLGMLARHYGADLIFDIGANTGQFGKQIRKHFQGDIISFEPSPDAYGELVANSKKDPKWFAHQLALGSKNGQQVLNVFSRSDLNSFNTPNEFSDELFGKNSGDAREVEVKVATLSSFITEKNLQDRKIVLKMDTQGFDLEVFRGLEERVGQVVALVSELSVKPIYHEMPHWLDVLKEYESAGFAVSHLLPVSGYRNEVVEYDCIMVNTRLN